MLIFWGFFVSGKKSKLALNTASFTIFSTMYNVSFNSNTE